MSIPSGETPLWVLSLGVLLVIAAAVLPTLIRPSRHPKSIRRYQREWRE